MTDLTSLTLAQARDALRRREFSATELVEAHLAAIEKARALNAFVRETPDRAREMARLADARLAKGEGGPLAGLPLGVKDVFCTADVRTTACSHILDNFVPALRVDGDRKPLARRRGVARQDQQRRIRHGLVERDVAFRTGGVAVAASRLGRQSSCPAAPRAGRRRQWPPGSAAARSAPIPAARSASRPRFAASSA